MVVETSQKAQESLRKFFTNLGYHVLVTENPQRALVRFSTTPLPADCLIMSTQSLKEEAVEAFNKLSSDSFYAAVPAILLASPKQKVLSRQARVDDRRKLVETPIHTAEMSKLLATLVALGKR
jgi:CheY-like chemotaxis protein